MIDWANIAVVALDFDGTLLEAGEKVLPEVVDAIDRGKAAGLRFSTASGRPYPSQVNILSKNGLGPETGRFDALLVDERQLWLLNDDDWHPHHAWNGPLQAQWERLAPQAMALLAGAHADLGAHGIEADGSVPEELVLERGMVGLRTTRVEDAPAAQALLRKHFAPLDGDLVVSRNFRWVHVLMRAAGKGNTLAALARHWGYAASQVLAVGDHMNDVTMLDGSAGLSAACVGNAVPEIVELVTRAGGYLATGETGRGVREVIDQVLANR